MKAESSAVSESANSHVRSVFMSVNLREITRFALLNTLAATCATSADESNGNVFRCLLAFSARAIKKLFTA